MSARITFGAFLPATAALFLVATGCGSISYETNFKVSPVTGRITHGGEPLADAHVTLNPLSEMPKGFTGAGGRTDAQGNFEIMSGTQKGAPAGDYKLTVSKLVGPDGEKLERVSDGGVDQGQLVASGRSTERIPAPYKDKELSPIDVVVKEGVATPEVKFDIPKS